MDRYRGTYNIRCCNTVGVEKVTLTFRDSSSSSPCGIQDRRLKTIVSEVSEANRKDGLGSGGSGDLTLTAAGMRKGSNIANDVNWAQVAERHGNGRKSTECMKRFNKITGNSNSNRLVAQKGPWTTEEDNQIIRLVKANGARKWSQIASQLPGTFQVILAGTGALTYLQQQVSLS